MWKGDDQLPFVREKLRTGLQEAHRLKHVLQDLVEKDAVKTPMQGRQVRFERALVAGEPALADKVRSGRIDLEAHGPRAEGAAYHQPGSRLFGIIGRQNVVLAVAGRRAADL